MYLGRLSLPLLVFTTVNTGGLRPICRLIDKLNAHAWVDGSAPLTAALWSL